jgi:hypothetical protein
VGLNESVVEVFFAVVLSVEWRCTFETEREAWMKIYNATFGLLGM